MRILFLGTPDFAAIPLAALAHDPRYTLVGVVTQPDRPVGRSRAPQPPPVKQRVAELQLDIPVLQPATLRDPSVVAQIAALKPDVGVVAAYGEILRRDVLNIPPAGYTNIHPSLLPLYRGPAPVAGAILAGDTETGVTVMRLEAKMDSGPILAQRRVPLPPDARAGPFTHELFELGSAMLLEVLEPYCAGTLVPTEQDHSQATYTALLKKSDGLIDWNLPAAQIERMVRAYDPWPGTQTLWRGQPLRVLAARVGQENSAGALPGTLSEHNGQVLVATGAGMLELLVVQPAGKRALAAAEWRRGIQKLDSTRLGE